MTKISENVLAVPRSLRIPRLFDACANSVYQALLFSSPRTARLPAREKRGTGDKAMSCHGVHCHAQSCHGVYCHVIVCTIMSWCALSCHGVYCRVMVCTVVLFVHFFFKKLQIHHSVPCSPRQVPQGYAVVKRVNK